jgi:hypothetical protein
MSEILQGIRLVKFCAWEEKFEAKIQHFRGLEMQQLKGRPTRRN